MAVAPQEVAAQTQPGQAAPGAAAKLVDNAANDAAVKDLQAAAEEAVASGKAPDLTTALEVLKMKYEPRPDGSSAPSDSNPSSMQNAARLVAVNERIKDLRAAQSAGADSKTVADLLLKAYQEKDGLLAGTPAERAPYKGPPQRLDEKGQPRKQWKSTGANRIASGDDAALTAEEQGEDLTANLTEAQVGTENINKHYGFLGRAIVRGVRRLRPSIDLATVEGSRLIQKGRELAYYIGKAHDDRIQEEKERAERKAAEKTARRNNQIAGQPPASVDELMAAKLQYGKNLQAGDYQQMLHGERSAGTPTSAEQAGLYKPPESNLPDNPGLILGIQVDRQKAFDEITNLGVKITRDSKLPIVLSQIRKIDPAWQPDQITLSYIAGAIDLAIEKAGLPADQLRAEREQSIYESLYERWKMENPDVEAVDADGNQSPELVKFLKGDPTASGEAALTVEDRIAAEYRKRVPPKSAAAPAATTATSSTPATEATPSTTAATSTAVDTEQAEAERAVAEITGYGVTLTGAETVDEAMSKINTAILQKNKTPGNAYQPPFEKDNPETQLFVQRAIDLTKRRAQATPTAAPTPPRAPTPPSPSRPAPAAGGASQLAPVEARPTNVDLMPDINSRLSGSTQNTEIYPATQDQLKKIFPGGIQINQQGQLVIRDAQMDGGAVAGKFKFSGVYENSKTPGQGLVMVGNPDIKMVFGRGLARGEVEKALKDNVTQTLRDEFTKRGLDPNWELSTAQIAGDKINFNLKRIST